MKRHSLIIVALAVVLLAAWGGAYATSSLAAAKPTAVAVVDMEKVFNALKEKEAIEADFRDADEKLQGELATKRKEIEELSSKLNLLPRGGQAFKDAQSDLEKKSVELQAWGQWQEVRRNRERALQVESLYRKAVDTIGHVATENGYDLVLFKEPAPNFQGQNVQQISTVLQLRKVLWSKDEINLTDQIITRMNNDYDAGR